MSKVISKPTEVRAAFAKDLVPGDILILGEGETRCRVVKQGPEGARKMCEVHYVVPGLTPERVHILLCNTGKIFSVEV